MLGSSFIKCSISLHRYSWRNIGRLSSWHIIYWPLSLHGCHSNIKWFITMLFSLGVVRYDFFILSYIASSYKTSRYDIPSRYSNLTFCIFCRLYCCCRKSALFSWFCAILMCTFLPKGDLLGVLSSPFVKLVLQFYFCHLIVCIQELLFLCLIKMIFY